MANRSIQVTKARDAKIEIPRDWLAKQARSRAHRLLAGHPFELEATSLFGPGEHDDVEWQVAGETMTGPSFKWTPRFPGHFWLRARSKRRGERRIKLLVGLRPQDLVERAGSLDFYFCLVARDGWKLHFVPLLEGRPAAKGRAAVETEVAQGHPAFTELIRRQTALFRWKLLPRLFVDVPRVPEGLYAIFPTDFVHLGNAPAVHKAGKLVVERLGAAAGKLEARGEDLRAIASAVAGLRPEDFRYGAAPVFPRDDRARFGAFSTERFASRIISPLVASAMDFCRTLGTDIGRGQATGIFTFNGAEGFLTSRVFDGRAGISRQVSTTIDRLGDFKGGGRSQWQDGFGRGSLVPGSLGGTSPSLGAGAFGGRRGQYAMDGDGAPDVGERPGVDEDGMFHVKGDDGSDVYFGYDANGNPRAAAWERNPDGSTTAYGDVTVWDFGDDEGTVITGGDGGDPEPDSGTDGGTPPSNDGGTTPPSNDGGTNPPDDGGGTTPPDDDTPDDPPSDDPDESEPPGSSDPEAGCEDPNDDGSSGGGGVVYTRKGWGPCGIVTRGGGYTDPGPEGSSSSGGGGGPVRIVPGGGVTDPPDEETGEGGFGYWGGYNPPIGGEVDPVFDPPRHASTAGASVSRSTLVARGVRVESFSGVGRGGVRVDGLVSAGMAVRGRRTADR